MKIICMRCDGVAPYDGKNKVFKCIKCKETFDLDELSYHYSNKMIGKELRKLRKSKGNAESKIKALKFIAKYKNKNEIKSNTKKYLKIGDASYNVGLFNKECKYPIAICGEKSVYLSYKDVHKKRCVLKNCKELKWLDDIIL